MKFKSINKDSLSSCKTLFVEYKLWYFILLFVKH